MTEHTNTPELRFPEFKEEWKLQKLGNLAQFSKGKSLSKKDLNINGTPCILYGELYTKYGAILNKVYSKTSTQNDSLVFSKRNQILIPSSGEIDIDIATATAIDTDVKIAIGGDLNIITPINSDGRFISLYINGKGKYNLAKYAQGKSVVHLYNSDIKKLNFYLPTNMAEQKKVGDFFSKLDRQIELEEEKLELLEQQKKGYMQKIFSQELRLKDENGNLSPEWTQTQLKNITNRITRKNKKLESTRPLTISGQLGLIDQVEYFNKSVSSKNLENYTLLQKNEFAYNKSYSNGYPLGAIKRLTRYDKGVLSSLYICFSISSDISVDFMQYYFESTKWFREVASIAVEGARNHGLLNISVNDFFDISIKLPSLENQKKISSFLIKIDNLIEKQSSKVELLKQRKQGLLQKMFI